MVERKCKRRRSSAQIFSGVGASSDLIKVANGPSVGASDDMLGPARSARLRNHKEIDSVGR